MVIKNKKNKGTFVCRNLGALKSKGEYLILPDPDDIISQDIIDVSYKISKKYNYEMIRFNIYCGKGNIFSNKIVQNIQSGPIFQPELLKYLIYSLGKLFLIDFNVSNKFVKRLPYINSLNYLNKYYLKIYMLSYEDGLMNYFLYKTVKSFFFLKKIGYYYISNRKPLKEKKNLKIKRLKFQFLYLKIVFELTKNTQLEKDMCNAILKFIQYYNNEVIFDKDSKDFNFYNEIINIYLKSPFIDAINKNYLNKIRNAIKNATKKRD